MGEEKGGRDREERGEGGRGRLVLVHLQLLKLDSLPLSLPDGYWHEAAPQSVDH